ncbi:unnamed protein product [Brassica oleracea var. botrytis]
MIPVTESSTYKPSINPSPTISNPCESQSSKVVEIRL